MSSGKIGQVGGVLSPYLERQRIRHVVRYIPNDAEILDIGCGRAKILDYLPSVRSYYGIDILDQVIAYDCQYHPGKEFHRIDIERENLPPEKRFDIILMMAIIEHFSSPIKILRKIVPSLKEYGMIIITTPHPRARRMHEIGSSLGMFSHAAAEEHEMFFDRQAMEELGHQSLLHLTMYKTFQCGLNQVAILKQSDH